MVMCVCDLGGKESDTFGEVENAEKNWLSDWLPLLGHSTFVTVLEDDSSKLVYGAQHNTLYDKQTCL